MAKKQSFGDKVKKGSEKGSLKHVKVINVKRSTKDALKFNEQMLAVNSDENIDLAVKKFLKK